MEKGMVKVYTDGRMGKYMMENGKLIKCMEEVYLLNQMVLYLKDNLKMIWW